MTARLPQLLLLQLVLLLRLLPSCLTAADSWQLSISRLRSRSQPDALVALNYDDDIENDDDADDEGDDFMYSFFLRNKYSAGLNCFDCSQPYGPGGNNRCYYVEEYAKRDPGAAVAIKSGCKSCSFNYLQGTQIRKCDSYSASEPTCLPPQDGGDKPIFACYCTSDLCNTALEIRRLVEKKIDEKTKKLVLPELSNPPSKIFATDPAPAPAKSPAPAPAPARSPAPAPAPAKSPAPAPGPGPAPKTDAAAAAAPGKAPAAKESATKTDDKSKKSKKETPKPVSHASYTTTFCLWNVIVTVTAIIFTVI